MIELVALLERGLAIAVALGLREAETIRALIVRGAYNQGFAIPRMPVRGTRA